MLAHTPLTPLQTEAGWNTIVRFPSTQSDDDWALQLLRVNDALVYPGHFFEMEHETCIVVSLLPQESVFTDGLHRLIQAASSKLTGSA